MTENPPAGKDEDEEEKDEPELWTVSAGGFSATVDAFAVEPWRLWQCSGGTPWQPASFMPPCSQS